MLSTHLTISATDFKATCLDIFTRLSDHRLERVTVTRRGKPVATLTPPIVEEAEARSLYGFMAGTVHIPPGLDLTAPVFEGEIDAESGRLHR